MDPTTKLELDVDVKGGKTGENLKKYFLSLPKCQRNILKDFCPSL